MQVGSGGSPVSGFDPDAAFLAFLSATNEKRIEGDVFEALIADLAGEDPILITDSSIRLFVPAIGEGAQAQELADHLRRHTGRAISLHGNDVSDSLDAMARDRLLADPNIESVDIQTADAFGPGAISVGDIDVVVVSHLLYYAPSRDAVRAFVAHVLDGLGASGVALFTHQAPTSNAARLRATYHEGFIAKPTLLVDEVADGIDVPVYRLGYSSLFRFPDVDEGDVLARIGQEAGDAEERDLVTATRLMQFVFRYDLAEMRDLGILDAAADEFFASLDPKTNEFEIASEAQVLPSRLLAADPAARSRLQACVENVQTQAPEIMRRHRGG